MEREGTSRPFGGYAQQVTRVTVDGTAALLFVQRGASPGRTTLDSVWVDARTWAPLRHVANAAGTTLDVAYRGGRVTGRRSVDGTASAIDRALPAGTLDYSVSNSAVRALEMCPGATVRAGGYDPAEDEMVEVMYRVIGAERVEIGGAPRDVWVMDVTVRGRTVRMLVDRATGRELEWTIAGPGGASIRSTSRLFR